MAENLPTDLERIHNLAQRILKDLRETAKYEDVG